MLGSEAAQQTRGANQTNVILDTKEEKKKKKTSFFFFFRRRGVKIGVLLLQALSSDGRERPTGGGASAGKSAWDKVTRPVRDRRHLSRLLRFMPSRNLLVLKL